MITPPAPFGSPSQPAISARPPSPGSVRLTARQIMICLAACIALQMTSYVMILPLFARRFAEFGAGVRELGMSEMAYALAATVAAPFMGALADRYGRRPLVLASLAVYVLAFAGYLVAFSAWAFVALRGVAGALTAGLMPAATSMVADLAPANRRAQWIGILSGGASIGWIAGPILGGILYDRWGYSPALLISIGMAALAFTTALVAVRETRAPGAQTAVSQRASLRLLEPGTSWRTFRAGLPTSLGPLAFVLSVYFVVMFAWAFIQPRFMFYAYDDLKWNSSMLGLVMSTYGVALMLGEFGLSRLSDTLGRKPVIVVGLMLFSAQFLGLALSPSYVLIALSFVIAGLGNALFDPALSASVLDVAPAQNQARLLGLKSTAGSLGSILGPALVVLFTPFLGAQAIFLVAGGIVLLVSVAAVATRSRARSGGEHPRAGTTDRQVG